MSRIEINETPTLWQPKEIVDLGKGCQCGIVMDDHCYVVLSRNWDDIWNPTSWIPPKVAKRLGELVIAGSCMVSE